MKYIVWLFRIVVGCLFIFSGLVKANDPLGLTYKMNEFFEIWHWFGMMQFSLAFSILMISFEILAGVTLLLGYAQRIFSPLLLLLNVFFTFLTAYALFSGKVKECGCFGDCIKISNTATFYKDVVLLAMTLVLFAYRNQIRPLFKTYVNSALFIISVFLSFGIQWWVLEHLPFYDCLPYKKGNNLYQKTQIPAGAIPDKYESVLIYQKDGVKKEFTMQNYPWQDTTWVFVDRKDKLVQKGNAEAEIKDLTFTDFDGNDHTKEILTAPGYTFLFFVKDPITAKTDNLDRIHTLIDEARKAGAQFYVISSADKGISKQYMEQWKLTNVDWLILDVTVNKTAMRSNPGLMLLNNGTVENKWSYRDYPKEVSVENGKLKTR